MVKIIVGNNVKRETVIVSEDTTMKSVLENQGIDYTRGTMHLDGAPLQPGDLNKTFAQMGVTDRAFLLNVVKAD